MERLSASDYAKVVDFLDELYQARDAESFPRWLVQALGDLVGSNLTSWNRILPRVPRVEILSHPVPDDFERLQDAFQRRVLEHPCVRHHLRTASPEPVMISDFVSRARFRRLGLYDAVYRPLGVEDQIGFFIGRYEGDSIAVGLSRDRWRYSERDRRLLSQLRPHVARAYDNARALSRWRGSVTQPHEAASHCVVFLDERDRPYELPPVGAHWLGEHFGDQRALARGFLPTEMMRWLRESGPAGGRPLVHCLHGKRLLARRLLEPGSSSAGKVLLLERHTFAGSATPLERWGLTRREIQVLSVLERGLTNEEIATFLRTSPLTVKKHLERIYRKLGVRNRTQAVARLRGVEGT